MDRRRRPRGCLKPHGANPTSESRAGFIFASFLANAFESQYKASLVRDDGTPTPVGHALINLDLFFTWVFTLELLMNIYAHWREEFVSDNWNIFDLFVVSTGHIAMLMPSGERIPVTILRLLRAFRVLRIFGRMKSIRLIINALSIYSRGGTCTFNFQSSYQAGSLRQAY